MKKYTHFLFFVLLVGFVSCSSLGIGDIPPKELEKQYTNDESKFINIDGTRVHYRDEGKGPVLLLIHGIFSSLHTWDGWVHELSKDYRIIRLDMPSWGLTGTPNFENVAENYIEFLKKFANRLKIKKFHIAGNSLGGFFAWKFAYSYPEMVDKLILLDAAAYPQNPPFILKLLTTPVVGSISTYITPKFVFASNIKDVYGDKSKIKNEIIDRYYKMTLRKGNRESGKKMCELIVSMSDKEPVGINQIKAKTLIMWGGKDIWIPLHLTNRWKKDLPNAQIKIYKGVGHVPMEEIPKITANDARNFLKNKELK